VLRCARDVAIYCDVILELALEYLSYDPNFIDNMEEDTKYSYGEEEDE
jgi:cullin-associated NEDD8-dissociated protein 1